MRGIRIVTVFIEPAFSPVRAAVAGARGTVPSGTGELHIIQAVMTASAVSFAFFVIDAFQRKGAFGYKDPVLFDLLSDG